MITIFSTPKDFTGIFEKIQLNALRSWRHLSPDIQIIILGDSKGSKEISSEINADYIPDVKCSIQGTPLLSDLFYKAEKIAKFNVLTFINADIILPINFLPSIEIAIKTFTKFLLIGHRWDIDLNEIIDYNNNRHYEKFIKRIDNEGIRHGSSGIDYFVFNKGLWKKLPDFIIGRPGYDNWLIWNIRRRMLPVIDGSEVIKAVHQNHSYTFHHIQDNQEAREGQEAIINSNIHKGKGLNILDSTHKLCSDRIIKVNDKNFKIRNLHRLPNIFPEFSILIKIYRRLYKLFINYE